MRKNLKPITVTAVMTALYAVLSILVGIPIINKIKLDLGYVVLGVCAGLLAPWQNMFIAGVGCAIKATISNGQFPLGWFPSNILLGLLLTLIAKIKNKPLRMITSVLAVFFCITAVKTCLECVLFELPFWAKIQSNAVASTIDAVATLIGMEISERSNVARLVK